MTTLTITAKCPKCGSARFSSFPCPRCARHPQGPAIHHMCTRCFTRWFEPVAQAVGSRTESDNG